MLLFCFVSFAYVRVKKGNQETDSRQGAKRRSLRLLSPGEDGGEEICWHSFVCWWFGFCSSELGAELRASAGVRLDKHYTTEQHPWYCRDALKLNKIYMKVPLPFLVSSHAE